MDRWPIDDETPIGDGTDVPDSVFITSAAVAPDVVSLSGSNIVFHNTYGSGVTAAFHQAVLDAEHAIQNKFTAGSTVDLYASFNFASLGPSFSGQNSFFLYNETYAAWRAQEAARATSPDDALAVAALPTTDPTGGLGVYLPSGYARMMGMSVGNDVDAIVLNSDLTFNFNNGDAAGVLEHELTEGAMGRISSLGFRSFSNGTHFWNPMDFFRFNASGVRDYTGGRDGVATYFGFNASHVFTAFQYHNSINASGQYDGFDLADWDHTIGDAFGPGGPGSPGVMSATDLQVMDVLGWNPVASSPGSIAISDVSISEGNSGTKTAIFTVTRTGGASAFAVNFATANGSATLADSDYVAASGTLSFGSGVNSQTISVTINGDTKIEFDETFLVNLSGATNGATISDNQAIGTISNDDANHAPVATIADHSLHVGEWAQIKNWASYSDADGDAAVQYQFYDDSGVVGSPILWTPGGAIQPANTPLTVSAANLGDVWVGNAQTAGAQTMEVRAFDGHDWGAWDSFKVTTLGNTPPVATISDHSLHIGEWAQIKGWISYSDADGDAATLYQFWDDSGAAGSPILWTPSGAIQPANTPLTVSAANIGNVWVGNAQTAGSQTMEVRAFDGHDWSAWDSFKITTLGNTPPAVTISDHSLHVGEWAQIKNWVSYSDADHDAAVQYQFWDDSGAAGSPILWTPSGAIQPANTPLTVSAANIGDVWVGNAQHTGSQTMEARAFDGHDWGAWVTFSLFTV